MPRFTLLLSALLLVIPAAARADGPPVTLVSLLREMVDRDALARFPDPPYTCKQFSSYDRASVSPDKADTWFANGDVNQYLRVEEVKVTPKSGGTDAPPAPKNGGAGVPPASGAAGASTRKEWVMADMDGSGAIVRLWSANPKGNLRIYLDHNPEPVIEAPMDQILGGKWKAGDDLIGPPLSQESSKGWNLYLPIPYAKHCKITSDSDGFYYQVNYRTYGPNVAVESFPAGSMGMSEPTYARTVEQLTKPPASAPFNAREMDDLKPGESRSVDISQMEPKPAPAALIGLQIHLKADDPASAYRRTVLQIDFDGETCVWCPVGDFFGFIPGTQPFETWFMGLNAEGTPKCRWTMPFGKSAVITLHNFGDKPVSARIMHRAQEWAWDSRSMHFHAGWRHQYPLHALGGRGTEDWNYVDITGQGVYVGDNLAVMNPVTDWWGEGDEKIYVDGETFPSHFGTGTEDYYGYAWCWPVVFQHPFHAQPRCDGNGKNNWGHTTVTRVRALDAIPFTKSLKFDMEVWHWKECDEAYAATTYWYALPGSTSNRLTPGAIAAMEAEVKKPIPQPPPLPPPFKITGAIECESMNVLAKSDGLTVIGQDMATFARDTWSGDSHLWIQARRVGDFVELEIPTGDGPEGKAPRRVSLYATKSWDYGIVRFSVNGQPAGNGQPASPASPIDLFSGGRGKVLSTGPIDLGVFTPKDGRLILRAEVVGGNEKSEGSKSFFGLDAVVLTPVK